MRKRRGKRRNKCIRVYTVRWKNIHPTLHDKLLLQSHLVGLELGEADGEVDGFPLIDGVPLGCDDMEG